VGSTVGGGTPCSPFPCLNTVHLAVGTGGAIVDSPIVDGTNGTVFAVNGAETANNGTILQSSIGLTGAVSFGIGGSAAASVPVIYSGAFDNTYYNSAKGATLGHMYVCGRDSAHPDRPYIDQLSFNPAGKLTSVGTTTWPAGNCFVTRSSEACSPVTEFYNPNGGGTGVPEDWIFFSVGNLANSDPTNNPLLGTVRATNNAGCVISVNVTTATTWPLSLPTSTTFIHGTPVPPNDPGSTSGFMVDNISILGQASSLYFTLGTNSTGAGPGVPSCNTTAGVGCAVKLTQSALN
jgi:hypothetical protein